ncbi:MAG TPA: esterase-like activity of phytase family protein [Pseudolabrys sp.]|nr:esterase-like activity of phytase family protein [Pseudolabrys sp.]
MRFVSSRRRWLITGILVGALGLAGVSAGAWSLGRGRYPAAPTAVTVQAAPIASFDNRDPSRTRFGALAFLGGLELTSEDPNFGGISAIHVDPDGNRFLAINDRGAWLRGRILYRDGRPAGLTDVEMAPMLGENGKPLAKGGWYDTESLTEDGADHAYVGIERVQRIVRFDLKKGLRARGQPIPVPPAFKSLAKNKSLECLAAAPQSSPLKGDLIAVTERSLDDAGNHRAFLLAGGHAFKTFSVKRSDDFDVSDCAILPSDDLLLLERRYSIARGVAMRIRRIPLASIKAGALVDGDTLIKADLAYQIDNMEGIGVSRDAQGDTILTLVSDDNFSPIQRTLLLQFKLAR